MASQGDPSSGSGSGYNVDRWTVEEVRKGKEWRDGVLRFHWDYYCALSYLRSLKKTEIKQSLLQAARTSFTFSGWQRAVAYRYALEPLSVIGSLVDPGGRFNIGDIDHARFTSFPGLYLAIDKATAMQEYLSQPIGEGNEQEAMDFALRNPSSIALCEISGKLDGIIDLTHPKCLKPFLSIIRRFKLPRELRERGRVLWLGEEVELIRTLSKLSSALTEPNWRSWPMQFDVPSSSQILGQLVSDAGIAGMRFNSKFSGRECMCVYPQNFVGTGSWIEVAGEVPSEVRVKRIDSESVERKGLPGMSGG